MRTGRLVGGALALVLITGCGGSGGTTPDLEGGGGAIQAGSFRFEGQAHGPQILSAGNNGVSVYALNGNITKATLVDANPTVAETEIVYCQDSVDGRNLKACSPDGTGTRTICPVPAGPDCIRVHPSGAYAYFSSNSELYRVPMAGGTAVNILHDAASFAISPDGTKLLVRRASSSQLVYANADGTGVVVIGTPASSYVVDGFATNSVGIIHSLTVFAYVPLTAGGSVNQQLIQGNNQVFRWVTEIRNGYAYTSSYVPNNNNYGYTEVLCRPTGVIDTITQGTTTGDYLPCSLSPDGTELVGVATDDPYTMGRFPRNHSSFTPIVSDTQTLRPTWGPFIANRLLAGANTNFTTGLAALIFSEAFSTVPSVVLADCTTRGSMTITPLTQQGTSNVIYRLDCDQLTKLYYTRTANYAPIVAVNGASGLKGALVSFDASTGKVSTVVTFSKRPEVRKTPAGFIATGEGLTVYDGKGARQPSRTDIRL